MFVRQRGGDIISVFFYPWYYQQMNANVKVTFPCLLLRNCPLSNLNFCSIHVCMIYVYFCLHLSSSFSAQPAISRRFPPYEPGPAKGFYHLKGSFFLTTVVCWGQDVGFCKAHKKKSVYMHLLRAAGFR